MDYSKDLALRSRMSPWQCIDCKTCFVCDDSGDGDSMLFCDACDKGYHMGCHSPKVTKKPTGRWVCNWCIQGSGLRNGENGRCNDEKRTALMNGEDKLAPEAVLSSKNGVQDAIIIEPMEVGEVDSTNQTVDGALGLPTPCDSPVPEEGRYQKTFNTLYVTKDNLETALEITRLINEKLNDRDIPDASNWSIQDVVNYFQSVGFQDQAQAFKEQEIDGKSLLLMKRSDVLTGLSIKLGPALKIYNYVRRLQLRLDDTFV